ncbi:hypothetical protein [Aporhodopirellula aestuarii]|uniref:Transmembrane protein n=1 Tax=Aporhodopirellula aestuarii TaxID=2950107 RepID=A0ABT0U7B5_9BACT|nr:hypothetical protein [Aporhodopirellula aestuarii]MCM2372781.1 hypothetical protein [Aporhodopirellula aestuarii]
MDRVFGNDRFEIFGSVFASPRSCLRGAFKFATAVGTGFALVIACAVGFGLRRSSATGVPRLSAAFFFALGWLGRWLLMRRNDRRRRVGTAREVRPSNSLLQGEQREDSTFRITADELSRVGFAKLIGKKLVEQRGIDWLINNGSFFGPDQGDSNRTNSPPVSAKINSMKLNSYNGFIRRVREIE